MVTISSNSSISKQVKENAQAATTGINQLTSLIEHRLSKQSGTPMFSSPGRGGGGGTPIEKPVGG